MMVNQVNNSQQGGVYNDPKQQKVDAKRSEAKQAQNQMTQVATQTKPQADSVSLTPQAQQLKSLQQKSQQSSGFDEKKVNELKKAIAEGKYQVDAEKLAKNIAAFEFDLYGR